MFAEGPMLHDRHLIQGIQSQVVSLMVAVLSILPSESCNKEHLISLVLLDLHETLT
jgi:hypothetical protein